MTGTTGARVSAHAPSRNSTRPPSCGTTRGKKGRDSWVSGGSRGFGNRPTSCFSACDKPRARGLKSADASGVHTMYRSILVPLDRSSFAERALPLALSIARRANARLDLAEVHADYALEDPRAGWAWSYDRQIDEEWRRQERLYLDVTAKRLASVSPVCVTTAVPPGSNLDAECVAAGILDRARDCGADLIVVATHARGLLSHPGLGSIADELIRRAGVPILVLPPGDTAPGLIPEPVLDNMLVPLDGSPLAEQVLVPALELARLMEASCDNPSGCSQAPCGRRGSGPSARGEGGRGVPERRRREAAAPGPARPDPGSRRPGRGRGRLEGGRCTDERADCPGHARPRWP